MWLEPARKKTLACAKQIFYAPGWGRQIRVIEPPWREIGWRANAGRKRLMGRATTPDPAARG
jgi:hypothetical protein